MIDFPNSPTLNQTFTAAGVTWTWDGVKWEAAGVSGGTIGGIGDNRIINGDMRIDQRNNGASGTAVSVYTCDRWQYSGTQTAKGTWQRNTAGAGLLSFGFGYYLSFNSSSAYASLTTDNFFFMQPIEADAIADFAFGTASAQPITLSFLVNSTLTGTFSGVVSNYSPVTRSYPFTFSIPVANAWTKIVITVPGDTAGTWVLQGNGGGLFVRFDLGSGANYRGPAGAWASANYVGATGAVSVVSTLSAGFLLTGVKLEIGSVATPYNRQSLAKSMADCQRYYETGSQAFFSGMATSSSVYYTNVFYKANKRVSPTIICTDAGNQGFPAGAPTAAGSVDQFAANKTASATNPGANFFFSWTASAEL